MNKKLHFFQSIHFKIALVFALLLFLAFQIVGAVFVQRLKSENLKQYHRAIIHIIFTTDHTFSIYDLNIWNIIIIYII